MVSELHFDLHFSRQLRTMMSLLFHDVMTGGFHSNSEKGDVGAGVLLKNSKRTDVATVNVSKRATGLYSESTYFQ